jgi:hypothetical protein
LPYIAMSWPSILEILVFASNWPPKQSSKHFLLWCEWLLLSHLDPDMKLFPI